METVLGFYRIEYPKIFTWDNEIKQYIKNTELQWENAITQTKVLISREYYETYKVLNNQKSDIESQMKGKKEKDPVLKEELRKIKSEIKSKFGKPFFVVGSPMFGAIETGIMILNSRMEFHFTLIVDGIEISKEKINAPCKVKEHDEIFKKVLQQAKEKKASIRLETVTFGEYPTRITKIEQLESVISDDEDE